MAHTDKLRNAIQILIHDDERKHFCLWDFPELNRQRTAAALFTMLRAGELRCVGEKKHPTKHVSAKIYEVLHLNFSGIHNYYSEEKQRRDLNLQFIERWKPIYPQLFEMPTLTGKTRTHKALCDKPAKRATL